VSQLEPELELSEAESRLARELLDSAGLDEPTAHATDAAWVKFSGALSLAAVQTSPPVAKPAAGPLQGVKRLADASASAVQWLVIGALAGSALTAAWLSPRLAPATGRTPTIASASHSAPTGARGTDAAAPLVSEQPAAPLVSEQLAAPSSGRPAPVAAPEHPRRRPTSAPGSTLAAEVAQLDAARTALEVGALDEAQRLLSQFHRDFPHGELAVEAQVLHLEVLSATADDAAVKREAAQFLQKHSTDPHAERVRQLATNARPKPDARAP
jgi:hypothetical protein